MKKLLFIAGLLITTTSQAAVSITDAWVRLLPPTVKTTAGYMVLKSDTDDAILSVSSPASMMVEMHESSMEDGVMSMNQVPSIRLPANEMVELKPHGLHLMIMNLKTPLIDGQEIELTLLLEKAGEVIVKAKVESR